MYKKKLRIKLYFNNQLPKLKFIRVQIQFNLKFPFFILKNKLILLTINCHFFINTKKKCKNLMNRLDD